MNVQNIKLRNIISQYELDGNNSRSTVKMCNDRQRHINGLHQYCTKQALETNLREYKRQAMSTECKLLFYKHLTTSKSKLSSASYNVNGQWMTI